MQTNLWKSGMAKQYFDIPNGDKILVHVYNSRYVNSFLVSGSHRKKDVPLKQADIWNMTALGNFCDFVDAYVESVVPRKKNLVDELNSMSGKFDDVSNIDFDRIWE